MKFGAHRTSHHTSISHLTTKPTHDALRHPARWRRWEDARALYRTQEAWPRCRLEAYAGGGYDIACRCVSVLPPPAEKLIQNPLRKMKPPHHPQAVSAQTPLSYAWLSFFPRLRLGGSFNLDRPVEK